MALSTSDLPDLDDPGAVEQLGTDIHSKAAKASDIASDVKSTWQGLSSSYEAPESTQVLQAMNKPDSTASDMKSDASTVKSALHAYADKIREFERRKTSLESDIATANKKWEDAKSMPDDSPDQQREKADAIQEAGDYEMRVWNDIAQLQQDVFQAQIDCANSIVAIYGGTPFALGGTQDGKGERLYGAEASDLQAAAERGQLDWSLPTAYREVDYAPNLIGKGLIDTGKDALSTLWNLSDLGKDEGRTDAERQGIADMAGMFGNAINPWSAHGGEARGQLWDMVSGEATYAWNNPSHFAGGLLPGLIPYAGWGSKALKLVPGKKTPDTPSAGKGTLGGMDLPKFADAGESGGAPGGKPVSVGTREAVDGKTVDEALNDLTDNSGDGPAGQPHGQPQDTPSEPSAPTPQSPQERPSQSEHVDNVFGEPAAPRADAPVAGDRTPEHAPSPTGAPQRSAPWEAPDHGTPIPFEEKVGPRTTFPPEGTALAPDTAYEVPGRGTYYTDADGKVTHVDAQASTEKGSPLNWDLNRPQANTTYRVGDTTYITDDHGRTSRVSITDISTDHKAARSDSIQQSVGHEGDRVVDGVTIREHQGGHVKGSQYDGIRERINLVPMLDDVNGPKGGAESFYRLETEIARLKAENPNAKIDLDFDFEFDAAEQARLGHKDTVPTRFSVSYYVDGELKTTETFKNVRDQ